MILKVEGLTKHFDKKTVLENASYDFGQGKIYGLLGRNGAGKTTMFNCLVGNMTPDSGEVFMDFNEDGNIRTATFDDIGFVFTDPHLPEFMTGQEFLKYFIDISKDKIKDNVDLDQAFALIDFDNTDRHKLIREYSHGMKNKLQMLAFLILRPHVILLDEPLASFDVVAALQMKNLIESIKKDHIIIFSTHILPLAQDLCDEIVILHNGKLSALDPEKMNDKDFEEEIVKQLTKEEADD
ncbi:MAG: ABC transporter ATP-binding protein [Oscillospiraceae bacterium]|nr:ABC transporter ATP-binding protein [Oscillospiraceae bacterium]